MKKDMEQVQSYQFFFSAIMKTKSNVIFIQNPELTKSLIEMAIVPGTRGAEALLILDIILVSFHLQFSVLVRSRVNQP